MLRQKAPGRSHVQYMLRTGCSWNIFVQQFVFVSVVANRPFGKLGGEGKIILRRAINRNFSEYFRVPQDGVTLNSQNGNRP